MFLFSHSLCSKWFIPTQERLNYSCRFLSFLDQDVVKPMFFDSYEEAYASVVRAEHWGVIHIMEDYSLALKKRVTGMGDLALAQFTGFTGTKVCIYIQQISLLIKLHVFSKSVRI